MSPDRVSVEVEGREVVLSNLDKVLFSATGFAKRDLIAYYASIAETIVPHLANRPVTLRRYPNGVDGASFFEKNVPRGAPPYVLTIDVARADGRGRSPVTTYPTVTSRAALVWAANLAAIELHVPMWRAIDGVEPNGPDLLVFDLDPGEPASIVECCEVALALGSALNARSLTAYPKTSGRKGLQLYALAPEGLTFEDAKGLARSLAQELERRDPGLVVSNMSKDRRRNKVLIDWSQNSASKTTIAPYSLRAEREPLASTPVTWREVERCLADREPGALRFRAEHVIARVARDGDLFKPLLGPRASAAER